MVTIGGHDFTRREIIGISALMAIVGASVVIGFLLGTYTASGNDPDPDPEDFPVEFTAGLVNQYTFPVEIYSKNLSRDFQFYSNNQLMTCTAEYNGSSDLSVPIAEIPMNRFMHPTDEKITLTNDSYYVLFDCSMYLSEHFNATPIVSYDYNTTESLPTTANLTVRTVLDDLVLEDITDIDQNGGHAELSLNASNIIIIQFSADHCVTLENVSLSIQINQDHKIMCLQNPTQKSGAYQFHVLYDDTQENMNTLILDDSDPEIRTQRNINEMNISTSDFCAVSGFTYRNTTDDQFIGDESIPDREKFHPILSENETLYILAIDQAGNYAFVSHEYIHTENPYDRDDIIIYIAVAVGLVFVTALSALISSANDKRKAERNRLQSRIRPI